MKKLLFILLCLPIVGLGQCVPDSQYTSEGIHPNTTVGFADAYVGQNYNQVVTLIVPTDTFVSGFLITIDSINLTSFVGLAANFTYDCNPTTCSFLGGNTGCVLIYSTLPPTSPMVGVHPLLITSTTYMSAPVLGNITQVDTITGYSIEILALAPGYGCTDTLACNYDSTATVDDGSCILPDGCTNPLACNYDSTALCDDGSCIYLNIIVSTTDVTCNGGNDGAIVATATGGVPPFQYSLGGGLSQVSGTFTNLTAGTYYIDVTDINGCTSNQTFIISDPILLESYDTLSVTASIVWNGDTLTVSGDYSYTLIDSVGCDSIVNLNLTINPSGILDVKNTERTLLRITDILGREIPYKKRTPLFYIYDDRTVEKRITIE